MSDYGNNGKNADKSSIELLGAAFLFYAGSYAIKPILGGIGLGFFESIGSLCFYIFFFIKLLKVLLKGKYFRVKIFARIAFFEIALALILALNSKVFPNTAPYYEEYRMFFRQIFVVFLPCGAVLSLVKDFDDAFSILRKYAIWGSVIMYISLPLGYMKYWDYQYWGIQLSPFLLILFAEYLKKEKRMDLILVIINSILLLMGGRQSLLTVFVAGLSLYIFDNRKKSRRMLVIISLVSVGGLLLITGLYVNIFKFVGSIVGFHMEGLERIASGEFFSIATRSDIYKYSFDIIKKNGSTITGILSDRYFLRTAGLYTSWIQYPHNIYLELLINFGTIVGTILSVFLTIKIVKSMFIDGSEERRRVGIILGMLTIVRLFVSSSYIIEGIFFVLLGFLIGAKGRMVIRKI